MDFIEILKRRRSNYSITDKINISDNELTEFLEEIIKYTPSAFNSQSQRAVLLLDEKHKLFWNQLIEIMSNILKGEQFEKTKVKINGFKAGYGTILFFDDSSTTNGLMEKFPLYKENFKKWAIEQNGMLQSNVWLGLKTKEIGASLQHYNELVEEFVKKEFNIPEAWKLNAQMPFGNVTEAEKEKDKLEMNKRFKIIK
ncbi:MAG: nitroreductase family protein [Candidatus Izimaplasma sp.]|nr:nitroreductase family protein [Candidatus Izimaplasma bacterium]